MIEYDSITVLHAWELTSVYMCYSQGDVFNTSLSRSLHCTVPTVGVVVWFVVVYERPCLLGVVMFGGTIMCCPGRRQQR